MGLDQVHLPTFVYAVAAVVVALVVWSFLRKVF